MKISKFTASRPLRWICPWLTLLMLLPASSCTQSPQEKLLGRWYASNMSLRFREDGSVVYNSPVGLAMGRYFFDPTPKPISSRGQYQNLLLDVVRHNEHVQIPFELEMLSQSRIRLVEIQPVAENREGTLGRNRKFVILVRADEAHDALVGATTVSAP